MDVEVPEVVEGGPEGPAGLHVVDLLGELSTKPGGSTLALLGPTPPPPLQQC